MEQAPTPKVVITDEPDTTPAVALPHHDQVPQTYIDASVATVHVYEPDDEWAGYDDPDTPPAEPLSVIFEDANARVATVGTKPELTALLTDALEQLSTNESDYLPPPEDQPAFQPGSNPTTA